MTIISPFRAVRPKKELVKEVASLPYDVVNSAEARVIAEGKPLSFLHVSKAEIDLPEGTSAYEDRVYKKAKSNFEDFLERGILFQDREPHFYIYRQTMNSREQYGIVSTVHASEFEAGHVKKHELTLMEKQADRTRHFEELDAQTGPIFLTYLSRDSVNRIVQDSIRENPEYDFEASDGIRHTVWVIRSAGVNEAIRKEFSSIPSLYIADGHHRAASALEVARRRREANRHHVGNEEYNYILAVLFPHDQLRIMDYNRAVRDLNALDRETFLERIGASFRIEPGFASRAPQEPHTFGMYLPGTWYRLEARPGLHDQGDIISSLDVSILQDHLLHPVLGIEDPRQDKRIRFIGGIRGMDELGAAGRFGRVRSGFFPLPADPEADDGGGRFRPDHAAEIDLV